MRSAATAPGSDARRDWRAIEPRSVQRWHNELYREYFCPHARADRSAAEAVRRCARAETAWAQNRARAPANARAAPVVPVDELGLVDVAEDRLDLAPTACAGSGASSADAVVDQAARDLAAVGVEAADHFAALEFAGDLDDADRQQALAVARQRLAPRRRRARSAAAHLQMVREPLLARGERHGLAR